MFFEIFLIHSLGKFLYKIQSETAFYIEKVFQRVGNELFISYCEWPMTFTKQTRFESHQANWPGIKWYPRSQISHRESLWDDIALQGSVLSSLEPDFHGFELIASRLGPPNSDDWTYIF